MSTGLRTFARIHRFFVDQHVYPLVLSSLLALALYVGRGYLSRRMAFTFLPWNLFLAWIPYLCSVGITFLYQRRSARGWVMLLPGIVWLIFLPNAPYIVTDLLHLDERPPVPIWYDIGLLATFAWTGCFLGVVSLSQMQRIVGKSFGWVVGWLFALCTIGLSGLGIYLGRFLQWNSWDLVLRPQSILADLLPRLASPIRNPQLFGFTLMFAAFLLVCYLTFVSVERRTVEVREP